MIPTAAAFIEAHTEACKRVLQGKQSMQDIMIVDMWSTISALQKQVGDLQQQLDAAVAGNAQSAQALTHMTLRLAGAPEGTPVH